VLAACPSQRFSASLTETDVSLAFNYYLVPAYSLITEFHPFPTHVNYHRSPWLVKRG